MENTQQIAEMDFRGILYIIKLTVKDNTLFIEVEQKDNGNVWKNTFTSSYLEDLTQKTGNYKNFSVFVKMLISSMLKSSPSVYLDVLTYHDLEVLRAQKQNQPAPANPEKVTNTKRYMILTYSVEYDKVHYPMPLNFEANPDSEALRNTIKRLRGEIEQLKSVQPSKSKDQDDGMFFMTSSASEKTQDASGSSEVAALRAENEALKEKVRKLQESQFNTSTSKKLGAVEHDNLIRAKQDLEAELKGIKDEHAKDVKWMKVKLEDSEAEIKRLNEELAKARNEDPAADDYGIKLNNKTDSYGRKLSGNSRNNKETERLIREVDTLKTADRKAKAKIRQLEIDLESAMKRATIARTNNNNALYSRNSPSNTRNSPSNTSTTRKSPTASTKSYSPAGRNDTRNPPANMRTPPNRVSPLGRDSRSYNNSLGSSLKSNLSGQSGASVRSRIGSYSPANSSANSIMSKGSDRRISPQRTNKPFGVPNKAPIRNQRNSPANRSPVSNYSLSSTIKTEQSTPATSKPSPGNRFGVRQNNYMANNNNNNARKPADNNYGIRSRPQNQQSPETSKRMLNGGTIGLNYTKGTNPHLANLQQKLKSNNYGSKNSVGSENNVSIPGPVDTTDINARLNQLQGMLNVAKFE